MTKKRWIGAIVRLRRDARLKSGTQYRAGCKFRVTHRDAGGIHLRTYVRGHMHWMRGFHPYDFDVLQWGNPLEKKEGPEMNVDIPKELAEALPANILKKVGVSKEDMRWSGPSINLTTQTNAAILALRDAVAAIKPAADAPPPKGQKKLVGDLNFWIKAAEASKQAGGTANLKCKKTQHFASMAFEVLQKLPQKRLFKNIEGGVWCAYYVGKIEFEAAHHTSGGGYVPDNTDVTMYYYELGVLKTETENFLNHHVRGLTVFEVLRTRGFMPQTPELDAQYARSTANYDQVFDKIGKQFLASGTGRFGNLDDLLREHEEDRWGWRWANIDELPMVRDGFPSRVVIDVRSEKDKKLSGNEKLPNPEYWRGKSYLEANEDEDPDDIDEDDADPDGANGVEADAAETPSVDEEIEDENGARSIQKEKRLPIPVRHIVPVFDLTRHMRLRVHTDNLVPYEYDRTLGAKLVLPAAQRGFITMMLEHDSGFTDIVKGKGGGAIICCAGAPGCGKCLGRGTPVLKYDGTIVPVEEIKVNDLLMGPDSTPRRVVSLAHDRDQMFRIVPIKGEPWTCNSVHVLTLVGSHSGEVIDIPLDRYLRESATFKKEYKLFKPPGVKFPTQLDGGKISAYWLGVWLGDGSKSPVPRPTISKPDAEILAACEDEAKRFGLKVRVQADPGKCPQYHITSGIKSGAYDRNPLLTELQQLMADEIRVPKAYLTGSWQTRSEVLAGLLDTDGHLVSGGYDIVQRRKPIADDICFLARSLGLRATMSEKIVNSETYYRVTVTGNCAILPLRIARKRAGPRKQVKNPQRTGFSVEAIGEDEYFGFTLSGLNGPCDGRFLLGDFTVTHNTLTAEVYAEVMGRPLYSVQCSQLGTDPDELEKHLLIIFSRAQRWNAILLLDEADVYVAKRGNDLTQNAIVGVFLRVLEYYSGALFLTTNRGDSIDDAVSSRCLARIDYKVPTQDDQIRIWDVLSRTMGLTIEPGVATEFARKYPHTSGRDIKNLLKLAALVSRASKKPVNFAMLEYVKQFKPTEDAG